MDTESIEIADNEVFVVGGYLRSVGISIFAAWLFTREAVERVRGASTEARININKPGMMRVSVAHGCCSCLWRGST